MRRLYIYEVFVDCVSQNDPQMTENQYFEMKENSMTNLLSNSMECVTVECLV